MNSPFFGDLQNLINHALVVVVLTGVIHRMVADNYLLAAIGLRPGPIEPLKLSLMVLLCFSDRLSAQGPHASGRPVHGPEASHVIIKRDFPLVVDACVL
jgi:hypothetical protein